MSEEKWKEKDGSFFKPYNNDRQKKQIKADVEKDALEKIKKCRQIIRKDTVQEIQNIVGEIVRSVQEDETVERYTALSLVLAMGIQGQLVTYDEMIKKEKEKRHPNMQIITYAEDKKDKLLLSGFSELRKMNDSEHNARYGKKVINANINIPKLSMEEFMKKPDKKILEEEVIEDTKGEHNKSSEETGD